MIRLLNTLLLIAAIIGGVTTYRSGETQRELLAEQNRLEQMVGSLHVDDLTKMHVRALDTGEPLHFAWRVYVPPGFKMRWESPNGGGSSSSQSDAREFVARIRFRESDDGILEVFTKEGGGSSRMGLGNQKLAAILHDRWDEIEVEQLGRDGQAVVEPDQVATLVRLNLSESLKEEAKGKLSQNMLKRYQELFFDYRVGSEEAFQKDDAEAEMSPYVGTRRSEQPHGTE
ncbi:MAG TPA: hypothetical protein VE890_11825 [Thermoguttaceae bacterium]|nr:hypothetical protein [Thermoguttaceae bacterium]